MGTRYPGSGAVPAATSLLVLMNEVPLGTIDGSNAAFTLAHSPTDSARVGLYQNGLKLINGTHYSVSGQTITFSTSPDYRPQTGDTLVVEYSALV